MLAIFLFVISSVPAEKDPLGRIEASFFGQVIERQVIRNNDINSIKEFERVIFNIGHTREEVHYFLEDAIKNKASIETVIKELQGRWGGIAYAQHDVEPGEDYYSRERNSESGTYDQYKIEGIHRRHTIGLKKYWPSNWSWVFRYLVISFLVKYPVQVWLYESQQGELLGFSVISSDYWF